MQQELLRILVRFVNFTRLFQLTYSMTRFAIYESVKNNVQKPGETMPFYQKVLLGGTAGCIGGVAGTPGDMVNVRSDMESFPNTRAMNII